MSFPHDGWPFPERREFIGRFHLVTPTDPEHDSLELYVAGHATEAARALWAYLFNGPFETEAAFRHDLEARCERSDSVVFTVRHLPERKAIGMITIMRIEPLHGCAELGSIWYAPDAQRTSANTEVTYLLLKHLFDDCGYRRVEWKCNARNEASRRAALRMGFHYEGTFRQHMVIKGESRDTAWFAMLDQEWPLRKAHFERALYSGEAVSLTELNADVHTGSLS